MAIDTTAAITRLNARDKKLITELPDNFAEMCAPRNTDNGLSGNLPKERLVYLGMSKFSIPGVPKEFDSHIFSNGTKEIEVAISCLNRAVYVNNKFVNQTVPVLKVNAEYDVDLLPGLRYIYVDGERALADAKYQQANGPTITDAAGTMYRAKSCFVHTITEVTA